MHGREYAEDTWQDASEMQGGTCVLPGQNQWLWQQGRGRRLPPQAEGQAREVLGACPGTASQPGLLSSSVSIHEVRDNDL